MNVMRKSVIPYHPPRSGEVILSNTYLCQHRIVEENITSALIFEDDADWDVRIHSQLETFALAAQLLVEQGDDPLSDYESYESPDTEFDSGLHRFALSHRPIPKTIHTASLSSAMSRARRARRPHVSSANSNPASPYGDPSKWDIMWLGHCGASYPRPLENISTPDRLPPPPLTLQDAILSQPDDPTVPLPRHLRWHPFGPLDPLAESHPPRTRVYHRTAGGTYCTVAYGVSQRGARRILHQIGTKRWDEIYDIELGIWCARADGEDDEDGKEGAATAAASERLRQGQGEVVPGREQEDEASRKRRERVCITTQPPVFAMSRGGESDIAAIAGGMVRAAETRYIRFSVRRNLERLLRGESQMVDQWPD
jgi:hypothetical protein